ncbi:MAG: molybdate transport system regulatory protein [Thermoproteota archaeon]|nr:molybdate transport system regulatory protein [Thermoproteota archaeon]
MELKPVVKVWLETKEGYIFGEGPFELLSKIEECGTLSGAAQELGMSYRHAWGITKTIEKRIGKPVLKTHKGGSLGGGGAELTEDGKLLLKRYSEVKKNILLVIEKLDGRLMK